MPCPTRYFCILLPWLLRSERHCVAMAFPVRPSRNPIGVQAKVATSLQRKDKQKAEPMETYSSMLSSLAEGRSLAEYTI